MDARMDKTADAVKDLGARALAAAAGFPQAAAADNAESGTRGAPGPEADLRLAVLDAAAEIAAGTRLLILDVADARGLDRRAVLCALTSMLQGDAALGPKAWDELAEAGELPGAR